MKIVNLLQKIHVVRTSGTESLPLHEDTSLGELSGSLASVARIAHKGGLENISLHANQGCISRMLATLGDNLGIEAVNGIYRKIEKVTCLRSSEPEITTNREVEFQFTQPAILTNILEGEITDKQIPQNARGVVAFFRSRSLPVVLLILNKEGCPTKISTVLSLNEVLSEPHELDVVSRAELSIKTNLEKETGYSVREAYLKPAHAAVPFDTFNFILDKIKK